jgi:hypothetical protein
MPKPNRGKTKTIKERAIYVYLPSIEMAEEWKKRAEKAGVSISRFVIERVEDSIRREEGEEGYLSRAELIKRLKEAEEEIKRLRSENNLLKKLVENLDSELKRYRAKPFAEESFEGIRRHPTMREIVGTIDGIGNDFVILKVAYRICIPKEELEKWSGKLRKGLKVGILLMDNGDVRVRLIKRGERL